MGIENIGTSVRRFFRKPPAEAKKETPPPPKPYIWNLYAVRIGGHTITPGDIVRGYNLFMKKGVGTNMHHFYGKVGEIVEFANGEIRIHFVQGSSWQGGGFYARSSGTSLRETFIDYLDPRR